MDDLTIRRLSIDDDAGLDAFVGVRNAAIPEDTESVEMLRWALTTYPATYLLLAETGGRAVGCVTTGRIYVHPPEYPRYWLTLAVLASERRRGIGGALLHAASGMARNAGKVGFHGQVVGTHEDALSFLGRRGFVETERMRMVGLDLRRYVPPPAAHPDGIRIVSLADRPDLGPALHGVALETFPDIPSAAEPIEPGTPAEFAAFLARPGAVPEATMVALDERGEAIGYTQLTMTPGSEAVAWHEMTAVRPAWRGRGIARALKAASIKAAAARGIERLRTANDETNAPMRAVNRRLGYEPEPDLIELAGPLAD